MSEALDAASAHFLVSAEGRALGEQLLGLGVERALIESLRNSCSPSEASALLDQERGRASLRGRHGEADEFFTTYVGAQQASAEAAANHRRQRFIDLGVTKVVEVGSGVGIDTRALGAALEVASYELNEPRRILAQANTSRLSNTEIHGTCGLAALTTAEVFFADPDRRPDGKRVTHPEAARPALSELEGAAPVAKGWAIKLSPLARLEELRGELEFVSVDGELKEMVQWGGDFALNARRISRPQVGFSMVGEAHRSAPLAAPAGFLLDPDPALVRSGLLGGLISDLGARLMHPEIAYATSATPLIHPLFRCERIIEVLGPKPKSVQKRLRELGIGPITLARRGFAVSPPEFERRLGKRTGDRSARLHLTRSEKGPLVLLTEAIKTEEAGTSE